MVSHSTLAENSNIDRDLHNAEHTASQLRFSFNFVDRRDQSVGEEMEGHEWC